MTGPGLPARDDDRGESLIELLIAIAILGVAVVAIIGGLFTSVLMSSLHRNQTTAGEYVHDYAEAIENSVANGSYTACATTYSTPGGFALPAGYTAAVTGVRYWTGSAWSGSCGTDSGVQQLTLKVRTPDSRVAEQLVIVIRKPCATGASPCS